MNVAVTREIHGAGMSPEELELITRRAREIAGLSFPASKAPMIESRIARRVRARGMHGFAEYCRYLDEQDDGSECREMIAALTTNVTSFFRESHHFDCLRETVLPPLVARLRSGGRVRLWSAGCSRGQEAYSLAMTLLELCPEAAETDALILGTDIHPGALVEARRGLYGTRELASVPAPMRERHFEAAGPDTARVSGELRALVRFRELNLLETWPMRGRFDVIFCRNVVIYFAEETQAALWPRFAGATASGGWLFLGHSERMPDPGGFGYVTAGRTAYRLASSPGEAAHHAGGE